MSALLSKSILFACVTGFALTMIGRAENGARDQWGQLPPPALAAKLKNALEISRRRPAEAEQILQEVIKTDPDYYRAQLNLGLLLLQDEQKAHEAVAQLDKAFEVSQQQQINDPTIYAEKAFAAYRADEPEKAVVAFEQGVDHLKEINNPADQKKLLGRAFAFFLDYQNPAGARKLLKKAIEKGLEPAVQSALQNTLDNGIGRLTSSDVPNGWVKFAEQIENPDLVLEYRDVLFQKVNGDSSPVKKGDIVTPVTTVNIRADKLNPANELATLSPLTGVARVEEQFRVLEDPVSIPTPDKKIPVWMPVERVKH